jgi:hypothetical protein
VLDAAKNGVANHQPTLKESEIKVPDNFRFKRADVWVGEVTPAMASAWLSNREGQRSLHKPTLERYCKMLQNGEWHPGVVAPIVLAKDGRLIEGQHRLSAIVKTKQTAELHIALGADASAFNRYDSGKPRTASDLLSCESELTASKCNRVTGVARAMMNGVSRHKRRYENADVQQYAVTNQDLILEIDNDFRKIKGYGKPPIGIVAAFTKAAKVNKPKVKELVEEISTLKFEDFSPMEALHSRMSTARRGRERFGINDQYRYACGAIKAAFANKTMRYVRKVNSDFQGVK